MPLPGVRDDTLVSEENGCSGSVSVRAATSWNLVKGTDLSSSAKPAIVRAYCDNRSRYENNQPGLSWTLDSVNQLVWPGLLDNQATKVSAVKMGTSPATRFGHAGAGSASGSWYLSENAIVGDDYVGIEAEFPSGEPKADQLHDVNTMFDSAVAAVH